MRGVEQLAADRSESVRSATLETLLLAAKLNFKYPGAKGTWLSWLILIDLVASRPAFCGGKVMHFDVLALRIFTVHSENRSWCLSYWELTISALFVQRIQ